jgi:hypothetical protein
MEIWHTASLFFGLVAAILLVLLWVGEKVADLLRTLRRIEARMTLTNPLEEERPILDLEKGDVMIRASIRNRALQPDIWWRRGYEERKNLRGKEYREERKLQRYIERKDRD